MENSELKTPTRFEDLLVEEKLVPKDLPKEIFNKINTYKMGLGRYTKTPTEKAKQILVTSDVEICDMISNHLEKDVDEESPEEKEAAKKKAADDKAAEDAADKLKADELEAERLNKEKEDHAEVERLAKEKEKEKEKEGQAQQSPTAETQTADQKKAAQVEAELSALFNAEKYSLTLQELKQAAPVCYLDIFNAYKDGEENGIMTSNFLIKETEKETFILSKL